MDERERSSLYFSKQYPQLTLFYAKCTILCQKKLSFFSSREKVMILHILHITQMLYISILFAYAVLIIFIFIFCLVTFLNISQLYLLAKAPCFAHFNPISLALTPEAEEEGLCCEKMEVKKSTFIFSSCALPPPPPRNDNEWERRHSFAVAVG